MRRLANFAHALGLFLAMLIICLPGAWVVLNSLRPTVEIMAKPAVWIPQELSLDAFTAMFGALGHGGIPVGDYFRNSLIISATSTVIAIAIGMCRRLRLRALPFSRQVRAVPRLHADAHRAGHRAVAAAVHHLRAARDHRHAFRR